MSVGPNPHGPGWTADCIFCKADLGAFPTMRDADRANDEHLVLCPALTADDRRAAFAPGPNDGPNDEPRY